jgi:hypothetical protein
VSSLEVIVGLGEREEGTWWMSFLGGELSFGNKDGVVVVEGLVVLGLTS